MNRKKSVQPYEILKSLFNSTALHTGDQLLKVACEILKDLTKAKVTFISRYIYTVQGKKIRIISSSQVPNETIKIKTDLSRLVYKNGDSDSIIIINENPFHNVNSKYIGFKGFLSIPIKNSRNENIGEISILSNNKLYIEKYIHEIITLFSKRIESEIKRILLEEELKSYTRIDPFSKLYTREYFIKKCNLTLQKIQAQELFASLIYIDIDNMKNINNSFGHHIGDKVILETASILQEYLQKGISIVGRVEGEKFCIIYKYHTLQETTILSKELKSSLEQKIFKKIFDKKYFIQINIKVVAMKRNQKSWEDIYQKTIKDPSKNRQIS